MNRLVLIVGAAVLALVLAAAAVWLLSRPPVDPQAALTRRAQEICQANTEAESAGKVAGKGQANAGGVGGEASVGSHELQKRGAGERVPVDKVVAENDKIRACMAAYVAAHEQR